MIKIEIKTPDVAKIYSMVRSIEDDGMKKNKDFDFSYIQARHDPINGHLMEEPKTVFMFYNHEYALIFRLKHGL
jgi:hypothetical protein